MSYKTIYMFTNYWTFIFYKMKYLTQFPLPYFPLISKLNKKSKFAIKIAIVHLV